MPAITAVIVIAFSTSAASCGGKNAVSASAVPTPTPPFTPTKILTLFDSGREQAVKMSDIIAARPGALQIGEPYDFRYGAAIELLTPADKLLNPGGEGWIFRCRQIGPAPVSIQSRYLPNGVVAFYLTCEA